MSSKISYDTSIEEHKKVKHPQPSTLHLGFKETNKANIIREDKTGYL